MQVFGSPGIPAKNLQAPPQSLRPSPVLPAGAMQKGEVPAGSGEQPGIRLGAPEMDARNLGTPGLPRSTAFARMSEADVAQHLENLKLPVSRENLALARRMMECNLPLTAPEFQSLKKALAALPRTTPEDLTSAAFLKYSGLPLTGENITTLASFIRNQPMVGSQILELQQAFRELVKKEASGLPPETLKTLARIRELLTGYVLAPGNESRRELTESLFKMAGRSRVEKSPSGNIEEEPSLASLQEQLGKGADLEEGTPLAAIFKLLGEVGKNLSAQGLINQATDGDDPGFFYFQIPLRLDEDGKTGEIRIRYRRESEESRRVDPEDAKVEFEVNTEHLGNITFTIEMTRGRIHVRAGTESSMKKDFIESRFGSLKSELEGLGHEIGLLVCMVNPKPQHRECIPIKAFEYMERVNVTA